MKKIFITIGVVVISASLLGLMGIQLYWINIALSVKEFNFQRGVSEAISGAIYKYNKLEIANALIKRQEQQNRAGHFFDILDSLNREYYREVLNAMNAKRQSIDEELHGWSSDNQSSLLEFYDGRRYQSLFDSAMLDGERFFNEEGYAVQSNNISEAYTALHNFFERAKIVNDLFDDLFSSQIALSPSPEHDIGILDSLLYRELEQQGITTPYEFGIYDPVNNAFMAEKTGNYTNQLVESGFVFSLFPNDVFRNPEFLVIVFPDQKTYMRAQMKAMMGVSAILMLVIFGSFTYTIVTIVRQKKLSTMKNDFINNMTHELKTPISTISLACQALRDQDIQKSEPLYQSYINVINEENLRLGMMTEKVLQTALLENGKLRLVKTGFNLHEVIEDAIKKTNLQLKSRHGKISTQLKAEFSFVEADKVHLTNLIFNLLDNAIKYSPEQPEITIITENSEQGIIVHVEDKGIGISKANQKKIFENLYRVPTGNIHNVKGFGLGLGYVKTIVELHGGHVGLQSELKKGSRFSVFFPYGIGEYPIKKHLIIG